MSCFISNILLFNDTINLKILYIKAFFNIKKSSNKFTSNLVSYYYQTLNRNMSIRMLIIVPTSDLTHDPCFLTFN